MYGGTAPGGGHMGAGPVGSDPMLGGAGVPGGHPLGVMGGGVGPPGHRSRSLRRSMGDVPPFGPGGSPSKPSYMNSISQPPSARGSPIGIGSRAGLMSPTRHRAGTATAAGRYGISRSSNNSPLTLPMEQLPQSLSTSSAFGPGMGPYYDDTDSPGEFGVGSRRYGARRAPLRSYHSIEREPGYRDRSYDRMAPDPITGRLRPRDRSLDRNLYSRDDPMYSDRYREAGLDDSLGLGGYGRTDPITGRPIPPPGTLYGSGTRLGGPVGENFVMELQSRLTELQNQYNQMKRELDVTTQKLGSSMHSIKTFWSPELKKERALRKEEAAKYALINDQLKILRSENQVSAGGGLSKYCH